MASSGSATSLSVSFLPASPGVDIWFAGVAVLSGAAAPFFVSSIISFPSNVATSFTSPLSPSMKEEEEREEGEVLFSSSSGVNDSILGVVIAPGADSSRFFFLTSLMPDEEEKEEEEELPPASDERNLFPVSPSSVCSVGEDKLRFKQQQRQQQQHQQQRQQHPQLRFLFPTHQFRLSGRLKRQSKPAHTGVSLLVRSEDSPSIYVIHADLSADDRGGPLQKELDASKVSIVRARRFFFSRRKIHGDDDDDVNAPCSCPCTRNVQADAPVRHLARRRQHRRHRRVTSTSVLLFLEDSAAIRLARRQSCRFSRWRRLRHCSRRRRHLRYSRRYSCCHPRRLHRRRRRRCRRRGRRHRHDVMKVLPVKVECVPLSSMSDDRATRNQAYCNVNHPASHSLNVTFDVF